MFKSPLEKARIGVQMAEQRCSDLRAEREKRNAELLNPELDFDSRFTIGEAVALLDRKIVAADADRERALREEREAADAEDRAAKKKRVEEVRREAKALRPRVLKFFDASKALAAERDLLAEHHERVNEANELARELGIEPVIDAERAIRETPARDIPADVRREMAWADENGDRPSQLRDDGTGRLVPWGPSNHGRFTYREVDVVQARARTAAARMPARVSEAVKLVGIHGEPL